MSVISRKVEVEMRQEPRNSDKRCTSQAVLLALCLMPTLRLGYSCLIATCIYVGRKAKQPGLGGHGNCDTGIHTVTCGEEKSRPEEAGI